MPAVIQVICPHCDEANRVSTDHIREPIACTNCRQRLFEGRPVELDDADRFARHAKHNDIPLLAEFWARWSGPSQEVKAALEQVTPQLEPEVRVATVESGAAPELADRYAVVRLPTLVVVRHGREIARTSGAMTLAQLLSWTRASLGAVPARPG